MKHRQATGILARLAWFFVVLIAIVLNAGASHSQSVEPQPYRLAPGDRISLVVIGQAELSGALSVDNNGEILVPLIGSVKVSGDTLAECQAKILSGLSQGFLREPSIFVSIAEARPVHVLGDVRNPGTFAYRFGSIVKSAIASAGGIGIGLKTDTGLAEYLAADERVRVLQATKDRSLLRKSRIEAQLAGKREFAVPSEVSADADLKSAIAEEKQLLDMAVESLETQRKLLEDQRPLMAAESKALSGQIAAQEQQIDLLKTEVRAISSLKNKGLARSNSLLELGLSLSTKESDLWKLAAERSRLQLVMNDLNSRIAQVDQNFRSQLLIELGAVQKTLFETDIALPSAIVQRANRQKIIGRAFDKAPVYQIKITRVGTKEVETFAATETTRLEPGDIVEIEIALPDVRSIETVSQ